MFPTRSRAEARRADPLSVAQILGGVLLLYYLVPLVSLLLAQPPGAVLGRLGEADVVSAATTSVLASTASALVATVFGLPLAYWLARTAFGGRDLVTALVVLPLVLPPVVSGMVLLTVVGPNTVVGSLAAGAGLRLTRSLAGVVLAQTFVASPFVVITAKAAFEGVPRQLEHASLSLGEGRLATVRRVTVPLALRGIVAGITLAFARSMGEFGATVMMAYYPRTMPVQIWVSFTTLGLEAAFPVAVVLLGVSVGAIALLNLLGSNPWR